MIIIAIQTGGPVSYVVADTTVEFPHSKTAQFRVSNQRSDNVTVTFKGQRKCSQGFLDDRVETAVANSISEFASFRGNQFISGEGRVVVTLSTATDVGVAAVHVRDSQGR